MQRVKEYTESTPFLKLYDKLAFNLGVFIFGLFAYIMGRWPNDHFYTFYNIFVPLLVFIRFVNYKRNKWHYFLLDFCYFGGVIVVVFLAFMPKSQMMYRISFFYSNGALGVATFAFSNALIFHKFDNIISLITHPVPLTAMWNVR